MSEILLNKLETAERNGFGRHDLGDALALVAINETLKGYEMDTNIQFLGRLDKTLAPNITPKQREDLWVGRVSVDSRIDHDPSLTARIDKVITPENLSKYYVAASDKAPTRCIDERPVVGYEKSSKLQSRELGAQVPGGTPGAALARRIVLGLSDVRSGTTRFVDDIDVTLKMYRAAGLYFGAHEDDHSHEDPENSGCGAIDKIPEVVGIYGNNEAHETIRNGAQAILGTAFNPELFELLYDRVTSLKSVDDRYLQRTENGGYVYKNRVLEIMREVIDKSPVVERLAGPHNGVAVMLNNVPGTTFDRDRFSVSTKGEIQVFNFDIWRSHDLARVFFPVNNDMTLNQRYDQVRRQLKFVHARVSMAVATLMALTDGSLQVGVRNPVEK